MVDPSCSLRVAVVFVVGIVIFFAVVFLFLVLFWLLPKEDGGSYRPIRRGRVGAFWMYSAHVQWYASQSLHL
jgi:hypothetical protein